MLVDVGHWVLTGCDKKQIIMQIIIDKVISLVLEYTNIILYYYIHWFIY